MKFNQYLHQSMAATGFCILDSAIAATLRPDLWSNGRECGGDFLDAKRRGFNPPQGVPGLSPATEGARRGPGRAGPQCPPTGAAHRMDHRHGSG